MMTSVRFWSLAVLCGALLVFGAPRVATAACQLKEISEFHVTMDGNEPLVDGSINGHPVRFLVDLGSSNTFISRSGAKALGLTPHRMSNITFYGTGGGEVPSETIIDDLKIGNMYAHKSDMMVIGAGLKSNRYVGLLGADILLQADIEFDLANGAIRIFKPQGCDGDQVVYWNKAYSLASIVPSNNAYILKVYVTLNGRVAVAQVDTGAYTSVVTSAMAERAGVSPATEVVADPTTGIAGKPLPTSVAVFSSLAVGEESIKNAKLQIADLFGADVKTEIGTLVPHRVLDSPDMLLGADFIRAHRIYVAGSQGKVYFSYNGGPIFQVMAPRARELITPAAPPVEVK
jgi:predicted aspartyl protease